MKEIKLKVQGKTIGFKFGLGFLGEALDNLDIGADEMLNSMKKNPFKVIPVLMFESAKYYAYRHKEDLGLEMDDFLDLIDDDGGVESKFFSEFLEAFTLSMTKNVPTEKPQKSHERNVKKK